MWENLSNFFHFHMLCRILLATHIDLVKDFICRYDYRYYVINITHLTLLLTDMRNVTVYFLLHFFLELMFRNSNRQLQSTELCVRKMRYTVAELNCCVNLQYAVYKVLET